MTKKRRLEKAWGRNWEFWCHKGLYFYAGCPIKYIRTPKELMRYLRKEHRVLKPYL